MTQEIQPVDNNDRMDVILRRVLKKELMSFRYLMWTVTHIKNDINIYFAFGENRDSNGYIRFENGRLFRIFLETAMQGLRPWRLRCCWSPGEYVNVSMRL